MLSTEVPHRGLPGDGGGEVVTEALKMELGYAYYFKNIACNS